jgi:RHS repeat-associated protein
MAKHSYGASNQRLLSEENGLRTWFAWGGGATLAEYGETAGSLSWTRSYVYLGGRLLGSEVPTGVSYHHADRLGTRLTTNTASGVESEQAHLPFGTALAAESSGVATNRRFTSYDRSGTTQLDYAVNRFYAAGLGRFTQVDPIGMSAVSLGNPQSLNLYAYVQNDPVNFTDPLGLYEGCVHQAVTRYLARIAGVNPLDAELLGKFAGDGPGGADSFAHAATNPGNWLKGLFGAGTSANVHFANAVILNQRISTLRADIDAGNLQRAGFTFHAIQDVLGAHSGFNSAAGHLQLNKGDLGKGVDRVIGDQKFDNMVNYTYRILTQSSRGNGLTREQMEGLYDEIIRECGTRKDPPPLLILPRMIAGNVAITGGGGYGGGGGFGKDADLFRWLDIIYGRDVVGIGSYPTITDG